MENPTGQPKPELYNHLEPSLGHSSCYKKLDIHDSTEHDTFRKYRANNYSQVDTTYANDTDRESDSDYSIFINNN